MYDTARRVTLVKQRVRETARRRQRREAISLSAACILLCAALMQTAGTVIGPGQPHYGNGRTHRRIHVRFTGGTDDGA